MTVTRQQVLELVRSWVGTPFHHQGRLPGVGLDCVGILVAVGRHFDIPHRDIKGYSRYPTGDELLSTLDANPGLERIEPWEAEPADAIVFTLRQKVGPQHLAIFDDPHIIHALQPRFNRVVRWPLTRNWRDRMCAAYRIAGIEGAA